MERKSKINVNDNKNMDLQDIEDDDSYQFRTKRSISPIKDNVYRNQ